MLSVFEMFLDPKGDISKPPLLLDEGVQAAIDSQNLFAASSLSTTKEVLYFLSEDYDSALETIQRRESLFCTTEGRIQENFPCFLDGLVAFAAMRQKKGSERRKLHKIARKNMNQLRKLANNNPSMCLAKYMLLEAEEAAINKKHMIAQEKYMHAITLAKNNNCFFEMAYGNQAAAAHFLHDVRDIDSALDYYRAARKVHKEWGAEAVVANFTLKIDDLAKLQV